MKGEPRSRLWRRKYNHTHHLLVITLFLRRLIFVNRPTSLGDQELSTYCPSANLLRNTCGPFHFIRPTTHACLQVPVPPSLLFVIGIYWHINNKLRLLYFGLNHNYNKILTSDWLSTVLISALIGQCNRTICVCLSNWTVHVIAHVHLNDFFFFFTASKKTQKFLVFWLKKKLK